MEVLGVFESGGFVKGIGAGYKFVVRRSKVVGKKEYLGTYAGWFAYLPAKLSEAKDRERAIKMVQEIEEKKDFELSNSQVEAIEFKPPGRFRGGHVLFKSTDKMEVKVTVNNIASPNVIMNFVKALQQFASDKVQVLGK